MYHPMLYHIVELAHDMHQNDPSVALDHVHSFAQLPKASI